MKKLLVISHSGGLDSTTLLYRGLMEGYTVLPVSFNYGQKNEIENQFQLESFHKAKEKFSDQLEHTLFIDLTSSFSNATKLFESLRDNDTISETTGLEYYMPFRNLNFISMSLMIGELVSIAKNYDEVKIAVGVHKHSTDSYLKDYWDITPKFIDAIDAVAKLNDNPKTTFSIYAPYKDEFKSKIIEDAYKFGVDTTTTWTCYDPKKVLKNEGLIEVSPCGVCEACKERYFQAQKADVPQEFKNNINNYSMVLKI